jgi:hypothetical protein
MQFQVPQFIETEDKVVGPFSLRQFAYVGVACLVSAIFYFMVSTWLFFIIALILVGGSFALSFVKVEGRPLINILLAAANFYWKPQTYVWQPEPSPTGAAKIVAQRTKTTQKSGLSLEDIISGMALKKKWEHVKSEAKNPREIENIAAGDALHKRWQNIQTGEARKTSNWQFLEKKMDERYQIFRKVAGDRNAARRVDYR